MMIVGWIVLAAGLAYAVYEVRFKDAYKASLQEIWTTPAELNALFKGKDGYYSETKGIIVDSIVAGVGLAFAFFAPWEHVKLATGLVFAGLGGCIHLMQAKDWKRFKRNLATQKAILEKLKQDPEGDHLPPARLLGFGNDSGRPRHVFVSGSFYDFYEDTDIPESTDGTLWEREKRDEALAKIQPRIAALARKPVSEWFKEDRAKSL